MIEDRPESNHFLAICDTEMLAMVAASTPLPLCMGFNVGTVIRLVWSLSRLVPFGLLCIGEAFELWGMVYHLGWTRCRNAMKSRGNT